MSHELIFFPNFRLLSQYSSSCFSTLLFTIFLVSLLIVRSPEEPTVKLEFIECKNKN
ncbi:hypothetical protein RchiOBHm_Chr7g0238221 [Rosa chinensis]|uniref:Uncharacterized protein n=1 Tax=Rosa chinensis TaxID=74649 RepID=A0A2P6PHG3_ROSCH|nr:hypothetical protein RchiOBHm_Chr7g0238221 [Rosa chinensis]